MNSIKMLLFKAYRYKLLRRIVLKLLLLIDRGKYHSAFLRLILSKYHGVKVGKYSYGPCLVPGLWPRGIEIGRYTSIADGVKVFRRDHPIDRISMHPFFYNSNLGYVGHDNIREYSLKIGSDVWIGANVVITTGCKDIGDGAVVAAGTVLTKDVPPFSIYGGVPGKRIKMRFSENLIYRINANRWWNSDIDKLMSIKELFVNPLNEHSIVEIESHLGVRQSEM